MQTGNEAAPFEIKVNWKLEDQDGWGDWDDDVAQGQFEIVSMAF